jgi:hypothetical protein
MFANVDILHGAQRHHGYHYLLNRLPLANHATLEGDQGRETSADPPPDSAPGACSGLKINAMKPR